VDDTVSVVDPETMLTLKVKLVNEMWPAQNGVSGCFCERWLVTEAVLPPLFHHYSKLDQ